MKPWILPSLAVLVAAAPAASSADEMRRDIPFATRDGRELTLDFLTPGGDDLPFVLCIHGGGWRGGNKAHFHPHMAMLKDWGYASATISYRFSDVAPWPAQRLDAEAALAFFRERAEEFGIDPERVVAMGGSAGGHLSLMLGAAPAEGDLAARRVRGVVNYFGPADLGPGKVEHARELVEQLLGGALEETVEAARSASPLTFIDRCDAPVLTFHGTEDPLVPFAEQAEPLHSALAGAKVPNELVPMRGVGHTIGGDVDALHRRLKAFLDAYLRGGRTELPLKLREDFDSGAERWQPTDAGAWEWHAAGAAGRSRFELTKKVSDYQPPVRSPHNIALLREVEVGDFVLDIDLHSTEARYGHQSLCLFFGYRDPSHFYYVHFGREADAHANSIFKVDGAPRVSIAEERNEGTDWSEGWHRARIVRSVADGGIAVYFDDMETPVMRATDTAFGPGRIGFGSFDDKGEFDALRLYAE